MSGHVTFIEGRPNYGGRPDQFKATCCCGWETDWLDKRAHAARAAGMHRANMKVQAL